MLDAILTFFVGIAFCVMLVRALWKKKAIFGGPPGIIYDKKETPIKYWLIVTMLFLATCLALLMFGAQLRKALFH